MVRKLSCFHQWLSNALSPQACPVRVELVLRSLVAEAEGSDSIASAGRLVPCGGDVGGGGSAMVGRSSARRVVAPPYFLDGDSRRQHMCHETSEMS